MGEIMGSSSVKVSKRRQAGVLIAAALAFAGFGLAQGIEGAHASTVTAQIATGCSTTLGITLNSTFPITTTLSPDSVAPGGMIMGDITTGVPMLPLQFTLNSAVITVPIPAQIDPASITMTFDAGAVTGSFKVSGSNMVVTLTGPTPLSTTATTPLPTIHLMGNVLAGATGTITFKVFTSVVADLGGGVATVATCTPTDLNQVLNTATITGGATTTAPATTTTTKPTATTTTSKPATTTTSKPATTTTSKPATTTTAPGATTTKKPFNFFQWLFCFFFRIGC
jgi:hypothetical protein